MGDHPLHDGRDRAVLSPHNRPLRRGHDSDTRPVGNRGSFACAVARNRTRSLTAHAVYTNRHPPFRKKSKLETFRRYGRAFGIRRPELCLKEPQTVKQRHVGCLGGRIDYTQSAGYRHPRPPSARFVPFSCHGGDLFMDARFPLETAYRRWHDSRNRENLRFSLQRHGIAAF